MINVLPGFFQAGMAVAHDQLDAMEAAGGERPQELSPVDLRLGELDAHAQDRSLAIEANANGHQHGAIDDRAAVADFLVTGVEDHERVRAQRPLPPLRQGFVQLRGAATDLGTGDAAAAGSSTMLLTFRVETPWTYISASATLRARSLRSPRSKGWAPRAFHCFVEHDFQDLGQSVEAVLGQDLDNLVDDVRLR